MAEKDILADSVGNAGNVNGRHIFIIGAKCIGQYGGYETFIDKLTEVHQNNDSIHYYIITKMNGDGAMDETKLVGKSNIKTNSHGEVISFKYHNADVVKLSVPQIGSAQAIAYDVKAFNWCLSFISNHKLTNAIIYVLACRIGPFFGDLVRRAHKFGCSVYVNPDGHEWMRAKWSKPIRTYWKKSERLMVKHADLLICDSVNIEKYIKEEYSQYNPKTKYIAYGADTTPSTLSDDDVAFTAWLAEHGLTVGNYYLVVGRFVPENNYETMIREFMKSSSTRDFALITNVNESFLAELEEKLHWNADKRVKFVGTVYDHELLKKIREAAYGYLHGHEVGGTNPSLLEALGSTKLNLLLDVGFNREVGTDTVLYWSKEDGNLANLIGKTDALSETERNHYGRKARERVAAVYSWEFIGEEYRKTWCEKIGESEYEKK